MKIFEIGVGQIHQCRTLGYIGTDVECWLFEPNKYSFNEISNRLGQEKNFKLFNLALGSENKTVKLAIHEGASYVIGAKAPALGELNHSDDKYEQTEIAMRDIRDFDTGDIDVLLLDAEGSEYDIIKSLVSRPKKIIVEMYSFGVKYTNPYFNEILEWMKTNNYKIVYEHEDFIFEKQ